MQHSVFLPFGAVVFSAGGLCAPAGNALLPSVAAHAIADGVSAGMAHVECPSVARAVFVDIAFKGLLSNRPLFRRHQPVTVATIDVCLAIAELQSRCLLAALNNDALRPRLRSCESIRASGTSSGCRNQSLRSQRGSPLRCAFRHGRHEHQHHSQPVNRFLKRFRRHRCSAHSSITEVRARK